MKTINTKQINYKILSDLTKKVFLYRAIDISKKNKTVEVLYSQNLYQDEIELSRNIKNYLTGFHELSEFRIHLVPMNGAIKKAQLTYYPASERYDVFDSSKKKVSSYEFTPKLNFPIIFHNFNLDLSSHIGSPSGFFFGGLDLSSNTEILINRGTELQLQLSKTVFSNYDDLNYDPAFTGYTFSQDQYSKLPKK